MSESQALSMSREYLNLMLHAHVPAEHHEEAEKAQAQFEKLVRQQVLLEYGEKFRTLDLPQLPFPGPGTAKAAYQRCAGILYTDASLIFEGDEASG